jgi:hypothetical protein
MHYTKLFLATCIAIVITSCTKDVGQLSEQNINDVFMYNLATDTAGYSTYQNGNTLAAAGGSPHGLFRLLFNPKAKSVLDGSNELPANATFPDSSAIVKIGYTTVGGSVSLLAVMYKKDGAWLWGEYKADGDNIYSVFEDPTGCTGCHNVSPNRDQVKTFDLH